jgi:hypothetical protein
MFANELKRNEIIVIINVVVVIVVAAVIVSIGVHWPLNVNS